MQKCNVYNNYQKEPKIEEKEPNIEEKEPNIEEKEPNIERSSVTEIVSTLVLS